MNLCTSKAIVVLLFIFLWVTTFSQSPEKITAFKNVNLVPMTSEVVVPNQTVVVEGNKIIQIGNNEQVIIPSGAQIIDGTGKYLMPGLADMHTHHLFYEDGNKEFFVYDKNSNSNLFLKNGVTTVRLYHGVNAKGHVPYTNYAHLWRDDIRSQKMLGPSYFICGYFYEGDEVIGDENSIRKNLKEVKGNHDFMKLYGYLSKSEYKRIMKVSKEENVHTIGHLPLLVGLDGVVKEGMDELAHMNDLTYTLVNYPKFSFLKNMVFGLALLKMTKDFYSCDTRDEYFTGKEKRMNETVGKVKNAGIFMNTTLVVDYLINEQLFEKQKFLERPELKYMTGMFRAPYKLGEDPYSKMLSNERLLKPAKKSKIGNGADNGKMFMQSRYQILTSLLKKLHDSNVLLLAGTDCGVPTVGVVPGYSLHTELQILADNGFTPYEAIKTATYNAGIAVEAMTGKNTIGSIELNKQADFILTNQNPLERVGNIQDMAGVMVTGKWLEKEQLETLPVNVKPVLEEKLMDVINEKGAAGIAEVYDQVKKTPSSTNIWEDGLKTLGYYYLNSKSYNEAIEIFKINVAEYPNSAPSYYRLGLAYEKSGNTELAKTNYQKSLELNPKNKTAKTAIKRITN